MCFFLFLLLFCVYRPFCLPILQQGQVGGILLPLQISSRSLRPTRHERFNQTSKKPTPQSIIICQDQMKTLLNINDKTIRKVGPQIWASKSVSYKKENSGKIGGHITSFFAPNLHPHTSQFPGGRERVKMVSGGGGSSVHYDQGE